MKPLKPLKPFSVSPSPVNLFLTGGLKSVIAKVRYTIEERQGLTCILGDVGMGKSSILRLLFSEYQADEEVVAFLIPSPSYATEFAFLKGLCGEFGIPGKRSLYDQEQAVKEYLIARYQEEKNVVVFIDEAQRLNGKMLEQVRALLNFETDTDKLIQIVLAGQLELRDRLRHPSKKAVRSRIFAPSLLDPLTLAETKSMIEHRCQLVSIPQPFTDDAIVAIYNLTSGVPRDVLKLCSISHKLQLAAGLSGIDADLIEAAVGQVAAV